MTDSSADRGPHIPPPLRPEMYLHYDLAEDTLRTAYQYDQPPEYYLTQNGGEWHVYSCSLWEPGFDLTQAQEKKLDTLAELMGLKPGMRVLDVGCGWGGPLVYLCRKYGVSGHGIAVAPNQIETARARARQYDVAATFELLHWQNLPAVETYDAIFSDEVITHFANLGDFFARCHALLRPGGVMAHKEVHLNHSRYAQLGPLNRRAVKVIAFTANYITLHQELRLLDENGFRLARIFEIPMVHYQRTLDAWLSNIFENRARLKAITSPQWYEDQRAFIKACRYIFTHTENCRLDIVVSHKLDVLAAGMSKPERELVDEIEAQRPRFPAGLLSRQEKDALIERGIVGLYRWYVARSQATRNWNPDTGFQWRALRTDHSPLLNRIVEGFFAVEQFVPDYTEHTIRLARASHGRAHFQIRWGAEEAKHSDLWLNAMLFLRHRSLGWLHEYQAALRAQRWSPSWDDAFHMAYYALVQERATQLNYLNTMLVAQGGSDKPDMAADADPVLAEVAHTIAVDEAAHYNFFLEITRLFLYYYPARTLEALHDVIQRFAMPALDLIPNAQQFYEAVYRAGIYGTPRHYARDVLQVAFDHLGIAGRRALAAGVKRLRQVPDENGSLRDTAIFDTLDYGALEAAIRRLYHRIGEHESEFGLADIDPTLFVPSGLAPSQG